MMCSMVMKRIFIIKGLKERRNDIKWYMKEKNESRRVVNNYECGVFLWIVKCEEGWEILLLYWWIGWFLVVFGWWLFCIIFFFFLI